MWRAAPLGELANPAHSPNPAKAAWYFLGLQELLLHMDALAAIILVAILFVRPRPGPLAGPPHQRYRHLLPLQATDAAPPSSTSSWPSTWFPPLVVADEYWLDIAAWLPNLPLFIANGLVPLAAILLGLVLIYGLTRLFFKANHSEALAGIFTFLMAGLIVLTIIGIYFRGPNMALVLPF